MNRNESQRMECSGSAPYLSDHGGAGVAHRVARIGHHATADRSGRVAARRDGPGSAYRTARFVRVAHHAAGVRVPRSAVEQHVSGRGRCPQVRDRGRGDGGSTPVSTLRHGSRRNLAAISSTRPVTACLTVMPMGLSQHPSSRAGPRPPTGSSASRPTLDCSRYVRRLRPSNRSAHKPTRMTPTPPRPPVPSAVLPAPWCTPPTSAWV